MNVWLVLGAGLLLLSAGFLLGEWAQARRAEDRAEQKRRQHVISCVHYAADGVDTLIRDGLLSPEKRRACIAAVAQRAYAYSFAPPDVQIVEKIYRVVNGLAQ